MALHLSGMRPRPTRNGPAAYERGITTRQTALDAAHQEPYARSVQDAGRNELLTGTTVIPALFLASIASAQSAEPSRQGLAAEEIRYVSSDLRHVAVFSKGRARLGPRLALSPDWGSPPARYFDAGDDLQCVSIGPPGNTEEFAVRRPIKARESYKCLTTSFRVIHCFEACRAAVVERVSLVGGHARGTLKSYMYVDSCTGIVAFSSSRNLVKGIPAEAEWLRGTVGILADPDYPRCRQF